MWKLKMKFRLGHFTSLQILFGFGTIVNLRYTSRLGLSSLALTNMITNMMQGKSSRLESKSNHPCLSQLASPPRSFKYG